MIRHTNAPPPYVQKLKLHLDTHFSERISIEAAAAQIDKNCSYLTSRFTLFYGISPYCYLTKLRMDRACNLLIQTQLPVSEISLRVGFLAPSSFVSKFRSYYGMTPKRFREQQKEKNAAMRRS